MLADTEHERKTTLLVRLVKACILKKDFPSATDLVSEYGDVLSDPSNKLLISAVEM